MKYCTLWMALLFCPTAVGAIEFFDVQNAGHIYSTEISTISDDRIMTGAGDGFFYPDTALLRSELTKVIHILLSQKIPTEESSCDMSILRRFSDVPKHTWYAPHVCAALQAGLVEGYPDRSFRPEKPVSFVEAAHVLSKLYAEENTRMYDSLSLDITNETPTTTLTYGKRLLDHLRKQESDRPPRQTTQDLGIWFQPAVEKMIQNNAVPSSVESFSAPLKRGELANMLMNLRSENSNSSTITFQDIPCMGGERSIFTNLQEALLNPYSVCILNLDGPQSPSFEGNIASLPFLQVLSITNAGLTEIPASIFRLSFLQELDLSYNFISEIPTSLQLLQALERLVLSENMLATLPEHFPYLPNLSIIFLDNNELETLPDSLGALKELSEIHIENNGVQEDTIFHIRSVLPNVNLYFK